MTQPVRVINAKKRTYAQSMTYNFERTLIVIDDYTDNFGHFEPILQM